VFPSLFKISDRPGVTVSYSELFVEQCLAGTDLG
jgi:hypothetical protein